LNPKFLYELQPGDWARIINIEGGRGFKTEVIFKGNKRRDNVRMVSSMQGPVVVEVNRGIIALGRGMARKIRIIKGR